MAEVSLLQDSKDKGWLRSSDLPPHLPNGAHLLG